MKLGWSALSKGLTPTIVFRTLKRENY